MALIRMFHYSCDAQMNYECEQETGDEYYSSEAKKVAKDFGWRIHANGRDAICPTCWSNGARW